MSGLLLLLLGIVLLNVTGTLSSTTNITILQLPINLTALRESITKLSPPHPLVALNNTLRKYLSILGNGSISCGVKGEECIPGFPSCCKGENNDDDDLECLPVGDAYRCKSLQNNSDELDAQHRLDALEYGDSAGAVNSHPWTDSWEFESRSAMEREELQAWEEAEWLKYHTPSPLDNFWLKHYNEIKRQGKQLWSDLKKLKKLRDIKRHLLEKKKQRLEVTDLPREDGPSQRPPEEPVNYPDETFDQTEATEQGGKGSDESIIRFSDEIPKKEKNINFRLDNIIKDAAQLVDEKLKKKLKDNGKKHGPPLISSQDSGEQWHLDDIEDLENKLAREKQELMKLKERQKQVQDTESKKQSVQEDREFDIDKLIREQVKVILDEERKLERLRKIEELKRLEHGISH